MSTCEACYECPMYLDVAIAALTQRIRADKAEAAIARVRELCDAHLNSSGRMSMPIDAAEVLRVLDGE